MAHVLQRPRAVHRQMTFRLLRCLRKSLVLDPRFMPSSEESAVKIRWTGNLKPVPVHSIEIHISGQAKELSIMDMDEQVVKRKWTPTASFLVPLVVLWLRRPHRKSGAPRT